MILLSRDHWSGRAGAGGWIIGGGGDEYSYICVLPTALIVD